MRVGSIDILRGLDMFVLVGAQPVVLAVGGVWHPEWMTHVLHQLDHEVWVGFRCWDLVMPLFMFMVGASMPFSFAKYREGEGSLRGIYGKIARRVAILFVLGMIVQGNLLRFSTGTLEIYNNTLQAIAAGYLIASLIILNTGARGRLAWTFALMAIYSVPMYVFGNYEPGESFAMEVDRIVIGRFHGDPTYTWVWSSLTFGATVMFGALAGELMRRNMKGRRMRAVWGMAAWGAALIALGLAAGVVEPIIKRLWTSSMTMYAAGWCMLLMALFFWIVDVLKVHRGLDWLKIYGANAITAYCIGEVVSFRSVVHSLTFGLEPMTGEWYRVILTTGNAAILFGILYFMYKYRIFVKV